MTPPLHRGSRFLPVSGILLFWFLWFLTTAGEALAHTALVASDPVDGAVLESPPREIVLKFSQPVTTSVDSVRLVAADGSEFPAHSQPDPSDRSLVVAHPPQGLANGTYTVSWTVLSADSHAVSGAFTITLATPAAAEDTTAESSPGGSEVQGAGGASSDATSHPDHQDAAGAAGRPADAEPGRPSGQPWRALGGAARFLAYVSALFAVGALVFVLLVHDGETGERKTLLAAVRLAALAGLAVTAAETVLHAAELRSVGAWVGVTDYLGSAFGLSSALRMGGLALLAMSTVGGSPVRARAVGTVGAVLTLVSYPILGHSVSTDPRVVVEVADLVHAAAVSVWFGGLAALALVVTRRARMPGEAEPAARMLDRFGRLAGIAVVLGVVAGALMGWAEVRSWTNLWESAFGKLLLAKTVLVVVAVAVAVYNNRVLVPDVAADTSAGDAVAGDGGASSTGWLRLRRVVMLEIAVLFTVLVITALLVGTATPPS